MKIGFFCNEYPPRPHGGIGTFVHTFVQALAREGHEITVVQWGEQETTEWLGAVRVVTLAESATPHIAWLLNRARLRRWVRAEALAGRIHVFEIPEYQGCLPFPLRACPVVVRLHIAESHIRSVMGGGRGKVYWLEKATLFWHRNWIGVSRYILDETRRFFTLQPRHAKVIYSPQPLIEGDKLPVLEARPEKYVVYVGSVSERKGALLLAEAMREVSANRPDVYLVYVGPETEYRGAPISAAIRSILDGYESRIVLTGHVSHDQALAWMRDACALAFVSRIESFGLVATEAMSLGVPVICAACGPGPEIVDDGVNGILIGPDSKAKLAQAILTLINDPLRASVLGEAGQRKVMNDFTLKACTTKTVDYYQCLLGRNNGN